jgi:hypothetical protein
MYMGSFLTRLLPYLLTSIALFAPTVSWAETIVQASSLTPQFTSKPQSLLFVGTSSLNTENALANKQALIAAEIRKILKASGLGVYAMGVKAGDDIPTVVAQSVAKFEPTHTLSLTVPSGTVVFTRGITESIGAKAYVVKTEVFDAKTRECVWTNTAQIDAGFFLGSSNVKVAEAIVERMRADGLL